MKILFLDIDGVLNSARSCFAFGGYPHNFSDEHMAQFDHVAIALVRRVCEETGACVVLSSSWRRTHAWRDVGAALGLPIVGATPLGETITAPGGMVFEYATARGAEIRAWREENNHTDRYAILDDDSDMLEEQRPFFVHVEHENGLQLAHYKRLIELL